MPLTPAKGKGKLQHSEQFNYDTCLFLFNKQWQTASSYYPGHGDKTHVLAHHDPDSPETDINDNAKTEKDWLSDEHIAGPSNFLQAKAAKVSVWITLLCLHFPSENFFHSGPHWRESWAMPLHLLYWMQVPALTPRPLAAWVDKHPLTQSKTSSPLPGYFYCCHSQYPLLAVQVFTLNLVTFLTTDMHK